MKRIRLVSNLKYATKANIPVITKFKKGMYLNLFCKSIVKIKTSHFNSISPTQQKSFNDFYHYLHFSFYQRKFCRNYLRIKKA